MYDMFDKPYWPPLSVMYEMSTLFILCLHATINGKYHILPFTNDQITNTLPSTRKSV